MTTSPSASIEVSNLWKSFPRYRPGIGSLKSLFSLRFGRRAETIWALQDISFAISPGESVAIIGTNGSGKSTLLGILSRVYRGTKGVAKVNGRIAPLLELGAGFHPELTGRENIYLNGAILGLSRREVESRMDEIIKFSGLAEKIDVPIKTYSVGMQMRLGFAIAVQTEPDVLLVDEVLAVGDETFQHKCYRQIERFQEEGRTILFVSHDLEAVKKVAPRSIWIHQGRLVADGPTEEIVPAYLDAARKEEARQIEEEGRSVGELVDE